MSGMLFLCGFPSSGTDLLKTVVNAHEDIALAGEFPFLPRLADRFGPVVRGQEAGAVAAALREADIYHNLGDPGADLRDLSARPEVTVAEIYGRLLGPEQTLWKGNKTPQNTENVERLDRLFPEARFILIVRDVR
ncbi:MAG TPA: sulfotransferase, partial [Alphaproteobacteria bacterium]|nr:sulfotransferase [Alphaproteobacteria bacterium]